MKKHTALLLGCAMAMLFSVSACAAAGTVAIDGIVTDNGEVTGVQVTATAQSDGALVAVAVYDSAGRLSQMAYTQSDLPAGTSEVPIGSGLPMLRTVKAFVWNQGNFSPRCVVYSEIVPQNDGVIYLMGTAIDASGVEGVAVEGTTLTITTPGTYALEGTLDQGQIVLAEELAKEAVTLQLNGVQVTNNTGSPFLAAGGKVTLVLGDGTENAFTDGGAYEDEDASNACVYARRDLTITGTGALTVTGKHQHGIRSKADVSIQGGDITVTAADIGVKGDNSVTLTQSAGTVTISSGGDGVKSDNTEEEGKGTVSIGGGVLDVTTTGDGDGIQADLNLAITGGTVTIRSAKDGIKANAALAESTVETPVIADGAVTISGGEIHIAAAEDGVKAAGNLAITGGALTIDAQQDGAQADADLTITGGELSVVTFGGADNVAQCDPNTSYKGIKAGNALTITGGAITVDAADDAIHSGNTAALSGGWISVRTGDDGVHADRKLEISGDAVIDVAASYEGLEAYAILISGGKSTIVASDDGINAAGTREGTEAAAVDSAMVQATEARSPSRAGGRPGGAMGPGGDERGRGDANTYGELIITGGYVYVEAGGDGLDSNGYIDMQGGTVLVNGPAQGGNGIFDCGDGFDASQYYFKVSGGTLIGAGTSNMAVYPTMENGSAYVAKTGLNLSPGSFVTLLDSAGNEVATFTNKVKSGMVFLAAPGITTGSYTLQVNGSYSGGQAGFGRTQDGVFYGLYSGGSQTGGTTYSVTGTTGAGSTGREPRRAVGAPL